MFDSILEAIVFYAANTPQKTCIIDEKNIVTYSEFLRIIKKYASALVAFGVGKGNKVAVEASQSIDFLAIELSLHGIGAAFVPFEAKTSEDTLRGIIEECEIEHIISKTGYELPNQIMIDDIVCSEGEADDGKFELPCSEDISEILFSTGTTGKRKGIVLCHRNDISVAENIKYAVHIESDNVEMIPSPLSHSHGLRSYYANMISGATVVLISSLINMKHFFKCLDEYKVNAIDLVPSALSVLLKLSGDRIQNYRENIRYMEFGAAPMSTEDRDRIMTLLPNVPLYNFYGSTESGRSCYYNFNVNNTKKACIGKPTRNSDIQIVDSEGKPIISSKFQTGLITTSGSMNMVCYYNDPAETEKAMKKGVIFSHDEAYVDEDGDIILLGRQDDVISIGGKKFSPGEVEDAAKSLQYVVDCCCVASSDNMKGSNITLFIQTEKGYRFNEKETIAELAKKMDSYMVPNRVVLIEKIPRSFNGKLLRRELKAAVEGNSLYSI